MSGVGTELLPQCKHKITSPTHYPSAYRPWLLSRSAWWIMSFPTIDKYICPIVSPSILVSCIHVIFVFLEWRANLEQAKPPAAKKSRPAKPKSTRGGRGRGRGGVMGNIPNITPNLPPNTFPGLVFFFSTEFMFWLMFLHPQWLTSIKWCTGHSRDVYFKMTYDKIFIWLK